MLDLTQGTQQWLAVRQKYIGSSDAPGIMGVCEYRSIKDVWLDKLGMGEKVKENPAMALGHKFEIVARARFCLAMGIEVEPKMAYHKGSDFLLASLDGLNAETKTTVEIKYMGKDKFDSIKESGRPTPMHYAQIQHQLLVTGYPMSYYVCYTLTEDKKDIAEYQCLEVPADHKYIEDLYKKELEFWHMVLNRIEPKDEVKDRTTEKKRTKRTRNDGAAKTS